MFPELPNVSKYCCDGCLMMAHKKQVTSTSNSQQYITTFNPNASKTATAAFIIQEECSDG